MNDYLYVYQRPAQRANTMSTKLTLRLNAELIAAAKQYAQSQGRSVSTLVGDYFAQLAGQAHRPVESEPGSRSGPLTRSLRGALRGSAVTEADHKAHLQAKHR